MEKIELLSRCVAEERDSLNRSMRKKIPRWLAPKVDSSDLIQDTFVELLAGDKLVVRDGHDCRRLVAVALKNNLKDSIRKFFSLKRNLRREIGSISDMAEVRDSKLVAPGCSEARHELIRSLLGRLPLAYGAVLEAFYLEGASQEQIGERLSRSKDAVRMLIRRAEQAAERILRADGYSSPSI